MSVKLIMYWDIQAGRDQEYFEFVVREWVPETTRLGLKTVGAWYSVYVREENETRIMVESLTDDLPSMRTILRGDDWRDIQDRLLKYVENYRQKVVYTSGDFQM
jgi:hypothetical protein